MTTGPTPPVAAAERGSITAFVAVVAIGFVMVAGMAYDGGQIVATQARARSVAAKAARAGAQEIDTASLRSGGRPVLDRRRAESAARRYLAETGVEGTIQVRSNTIEVTVTIAQPMRILPVGTRIVRATDAASAVKAPSAEAVP